MNATAILRTRSRTYRRHGAVVKSATAPPGALAFFVNDFSMSDPCPWHVFSDDAPGPKPAAGGLPAGPWEDPDKGEFSEIFESVMAGIRDRSLTKAVPVSTASATLEHPPGQWLQDRLLRDDFPPGSGHAFMWDAGEQGFGGLTPELLFNLEGRELTTMALAGTADAAHADELLHRPKLAREHAIVVDELRRRLQPLGEVHAGEREVVALGTLFHLRTALRVTLREEPQGTAFNALIHLLHPTPALGISPRTPASMALLHSWRTRMHTPAFFGAPFGAAWPGGATVLVAIRGFFWDAGRLHLPAGCGLVAGSEATSEWEEMELKRAWVRRSFGTS